MGRFVGEDPIGFQGELNLFTYASGLPTLLVDPYGFKVQMNLFPGSDPGHRLAEAYEPAENEFAIAGHGHPGTVWDRDGIWEMPLSPFALAKKIAEWPTFRAGMKVKLMVCYTGLPAPKRTFDVPQGEVYAAFLAKYLGYWLKKLYGWEGGVLVEAPDDLVWWLPGEQPLVAPRHPSNRRQPDRQHPGHWQPFRVN